MTFLAGFLAVVAFAAVLDRSGIVDAAAKAIRTSQDATQTLRDPSRSDDQKERAMREASLSLIVSFLSIFLRGAAGVGASLLVVVLFHASGLAPFADVTGWLSEPLTVVFMSALVVAWFLLRPRS
jgi:hypothetical protein